MSTSSSSLQTIGHGYKSKVKPRATNAPRVDEPKALDKVTSFIIRQARYLPKTKRGYVDWNTIASKVNDTFEMGEGKDLKVEATWHACKWRWAKFGVHNVVLKNEKIPAFWLKKWMMDPNEKQEKEKKLFKMVEEGTDVDPGLVWDCRVWLDEVCFRKKRTEAKQDGEGMDADEGNSSEAVDEKDASEAAEEMDWPADLQDLPEDSNVDWRETAIEANEAVEAVNAELKKLREAVRVAISAQYLAKVEGFWG